MLNRNGKGRGATAAIRLACLILCRDGQLKCGLGGNCPLIGQARSCNLVQGQVRSSRLVLRLFHAVPGRKPKPWSN